MIAFLTTLLLSVNLKKTTNNLIKRKSSKSINFLDVDSVKCYGAYQAALSALNLVEDRHSLNFKSGESEAEAALGIFETECAITAAGNDCAGFLSTHTSVTEGLGSDFTADCLVAAPNADATDCEDAYDALVDALQDNSGKKKAINVKGSPEDEFNSFVTKCAKTSHTEGCYDLIKDISTETGPAKTALANIQSKCNPTQIQPGGNGGEGGENGNGNGNDDAQLVFSPNIKVAMFICLLFHFYF